MRLKDFSIGAKDCNVMITDGHNHWWYSLESVPDEKKNLFIHYMRVCQNGKIFILLESDLQCYLCFKEIYHKKEQVFETDVIRIYYDRDDAKRFCDENEKDEYDNENERMCYYYLKREMC